MADAVAPRNPWLGVMLPYTPLHHLLLHELDGTPLVMTSGNRSDEPIAYEDSRCARTPGRHRRLLPDSRPADSPALRRLGDAGRRRRSSCRSAARAAMPRGRLRLPVACRRPTLAARRPAEGDVALGRGRHAFLSHHIGDLDHYEAFRAYVEAIAHYERLFDLRPAVSVHDLHPDYASTRYAERARRVAPD